MLIWEDLFAFRMIEFAKGASDRLFIGGVVSSVIGDFVESVVDAPGSAAGDFQPFVGDGVGGSIGRFLSTFATAGGIGRQFRGCQIANELAGEWFALVVDAFGDASMSLFM